MNKNFDSFNRDADLISTMQASQEQSVPEHTFDSDWGSYGGDEAWMGDVDDPVKKNPQQTSNFARFWDENKDTIRDVT